MKKINIVISVLIIIVSLVVSNKGAEMRSSSQKNIAQVNSDGYEISTSMYVKEEENNSISIQYPKISGLNDKDLEKKINEIIKTETFKVYNYYDYLDREHLNLEIKYNVSLKSESILSIQYSGLGYVENAAHPNKLFYTTNIDMKTGCRLRLRDLVNINEKIINMFINGEFKPLWKEQEKFALKYYKTYDKVRKKFIHGDYMDNIGTFNQSDVYSYLTNDSLGISVPVIYAIGGHAEFEINYKDIIEYLKKDSEGWEIFLDNIME